MRICAPSSAGSTARDCAARDLSDLLHPAPVVVGLRVAPARQLLERLTLLGQKPVFGGDAGRELVDRNQLGRDLAVRLLFARGQGTQIAAKAPRLLLQLDQRWRQQPAPVNLARRLGRDRRRDEHCRRHGSRQGAKHGAPPQGNEARVSLRIALDPARSAQGRVLSSACALQLNAVPVSAGRPHGHSYQGQVSETCWAAVCASTRR